MATMLAMQVSPLMLCLSKACVVCHSKSKVAITLPVDFGLGIRLSIHGKIRA